MRKKLKNQLQKRKSKKVIIICLGALVLHLILSSVLSFVMSLFVYSVKYNTSSIIITHDLTCAKKVGDKVAMLLDGKFLKVGKFNDVFESDDKQIKSFFNYNFIQ